jgi:tetratricopeptide (TPR) repeat protein
VKVDRSSRQGFALLGEVLLRRQDFERAVPVLQHAQNLDPTSPQILAMLKRARSGQPLEPPPPVPNPVPPRGETQYAARLDQALRARGVASPTTPQTPSRRAAAAGPVMSEPVHDWRNEPATEHAPPPSFAEMSPLPEAPAERAARPPAAPPPPSNIEGVRPRLIQAAKQKNPAAASLRQSAAVGETYLNDLLTGGLLDIAGVRSSEADFDLKPDRRWGRSTRRAFVFLFVVLVLGIGGGGTWYWWSEKQKSEAVARLQRESQLAIPTGDFAGFETCLKKLGDALDKDKTSLLTYAYFAECSGLEALLYGTDADRVDQALKIAKELKDDEPGAREVLIGKSAVELSRLTIGDGSQAVAQVAKTTLAEVKKALEAYTAKHKDKWAQWLLGRAELAGGERRAGRELVKAAAEGDDGLVVAQIDVADLLVDDGELEQALAAYDKAAVKAKDHPLIIVGRSLARAEASLKNDETIGELSVKLAKELPARLSAYRHLAASLANFAIESYATANDELRKATAQHPPNEPRFWARVAWLQVARGDISGAAAAGSKIAWFGQSKAEDDPTAKLIDAALKLASGLPDQSLEISAKLVGVRPQLLRAEADLDLGKPKDALREADDILKKVPDNLEAQILREQARMVSTEGKERVEATDALEKLARRAKSKIGRHALGIAHATNGNLKESQAQLEQALLDITEEAPNPLVYRTRTALAEILLANGDIAGAGKQLDEALKVNSGYFPTRALQAKVVLRYGQPDRALDMLKPVFDEIKTVPPAWKLLYAEALGTRKNATAKDKDEATEVLKALEEVLPPGDVARAAAAIDPKLPKELGLPEPVAEPAPGTAGKSAKSAPPARSPDKPKHRR